MDGRSVRWKMFSSQLIRQAAGFCCVGTTWFLVQLSSSGMMCFVVVLWKIASFCLLNLTFSGHLRSVFAKIDPIQLNLLSCFVGYTDEQWVSARVTTPPSIYCFSCSLTSFSSIFFLFSDSYYMCWWQVMVIFLLLLFVFDWMGHLSSPLTVFLLILKQLQARDDEYHLLITHPPSMYV